MQRNIKGLDAETALGLIFVELGKESEEGLELVEKGYEIMKTILPGEDPRLKRASKILSLMTITGDR